MKIFSREVERGIKELKLQGIRIVSGDEYDELLNSTLNKFTRSDKYTFPLWQRVTQKFSVKSDESWKWIVDYESTKECFMFFEPNKERTGFIFPNKKSLTDTIGECFLFVFYITDLDSSYLIAQNDHDYLIASGDEAIQWLKARTESIRSRLHLRHLKRRTN